jgi:hypothetical protein
VGGIRFGDIEVGLHSVAMRTINYNVMIVE